MVKDYITLARTPDQARFARHSERTSRHTWVPYKKFIPSGIAVFLGLLIFFTGLCIAFFMLKRQSHWDGLSSHTFVVISGDAQSSTRHLTIVTVNGKDKSAVVFPLPDTMMIDTLYGYGQYKVESLPGLGKLEKLPYTFITQTLAFGLGIDVRDVVIFSGDFNITSTKGLQRVFAETLTLKAESSFPYYDRYLMWNVLRSLRKDKLNAVDVTSANVLKRATTPGGEPGYTIDVLKMDALVTQLFTDVAYRKEGRTIAVVNTTSEARLATRVARTLTLMGIDVVNIQQTSSILERTRLEYEDNMMATSRAVDTIRTLFQLAQSGEGVSPQHSIEYRADLVLFLGKDAAQLFTRQTRD